MSNIKYCPDCSPPETADEYGICSPCGLHWIGRGGGGGLCCFFLLGFFFSFAGILCTNFILFAQHIHEVAILFRKNFSVKMAYSG